MKKIMNAPENTVKEIMEGFAGAYERYYEKHPRVNGIILKRHRKSQVALVIGGGSGHEPMFSGFVGEGLADAAACGNIFASPDPNTIYQTARTVESGRGVLFVYGCYSGDNLNFDMGEEMLRADGIRTAHVRVRDDVASAPRERITDRRGIAGDLFVIKIAGAACDAGLDLADAARVAQKAGDNVWSIGAATSPAQLPGSDQPIFRLEEGKIEYGMGIRGEKGVCRMDWRSADELGEMMYRQIIEESGIREGDEICVLVNSLGSTSVAELAIIYGNVKRLLLQNGIHIYDADLNHYCTSQEMGGFSLTFFRLDEELKRYYDMPCHSPYYTKEARKAVRKSECGVNPGTESGEKRKGESGKKRKIKRTKEGELFVLGVQDAGAMLDYVADKMIGRKDFLTEIDSAIGDGDHGIGMAVGMRKVKETVREMGETQNVCELFDAAGRAMLMSMGGESGVIFGSLFYAGVSGQAVKSEFTARDMAEMFRKALTAIRERGGARVGDKTMVDALEPAVEAMEANAGRGFLKMMRSAEEAAWSGAEASRDYPAGFGRAKALGERAIGYRDAGAVSVWLILQGIREFIEGGNNPEGREREEDISGKQSENV